MRNLCEIYVKTGREQKGAKHSRTKLQCRPPPTANHTMGSDAQLPPSSSSSSSRARMTALNHSHIAQARLASPDDGRTLDLSHKSLGEVGESGAEELARIGTGEPDRKSTITRSVSIPINAFKYWCSRPLKLTYLFCLSKGGIGLQPPQHPSQSLCSLNPAALS